MERDELPSENAALSHPMTDEPTLRRPYLRPQLRLLGSVRDLTLGSVAGMAEGAGTFRAM